MTILVVTENKSFQIENSEKERGLQLLESGVADLYLIKRIDATTTELKQLTIDPTPKTQVTYETTVILADGNQIATIDRPV